METVDYGITTDETHQKLRNQYHQLSGYYQSIIAELPGHVYWKDKLGVYQGCNQQQAKLAGLQTYHDIVGLTDTELPWNANKPHVVREIQATDRQVIEQGRSFTIEEPGSDERIYLSHKAPLRDKAGKIIGIIGFSVDITDKKQVERLEIEKQQSQLVADTMQMLASSLAHELRTPLAIVAGTKNILNRHLTKLLSMAEYAIEHGYQNPMKVSTLADLNSLAGMLNHQINQANMHIDMMLNNVRMGKIDNKDFTHISMRSLVEEVLLEYPFAYNEAEKIHTDFKQDFHFYGDMLLVKNIFFNLLKNSLYFIHYMRRGEITIAVDNVNNQNIVRFTDTAKGMSAEEVAQVFQQFYSNRRGGAGIGLAFCKMAMCSMQGDIICIAKDGEFTEFQLLF